MIKLATLFSDGAVLQRDMQIPVWGRTNPETIVHVVCGTAEAYGKSSADGKFTVYLPPLPAGGPLELKVTAGTETVVVRDILAGEVWIAGGQSNMQYQLNSDWAVKRPEEGETLLSRIQEKEFVDSIREPDQVRSIVVPRIATGTTEESFEGTWRKMTRDQAPAFSAVGAWFAKTVQEKLHVPVGLIECNWGGTIAETWTSRSGLMRNPVTAAILHEADTRFRDEHAWIKRYCTTVSSDIIEKLGAKDTGNTGVANGWAEPEFNDENWKDMKVPGSWIRQKISGNGVLWVRRTVDIPKKWAGKPLVLNLGPVDKQDTTYFNGVEVGRTGTGFETKYWDVPRKYQIPAELVKAGNAVVAVRAYSFFYDGSLSVSTLENPENGESISLSGIWKAFPETDFGILCPANNPELKFCHGNPNIAATLFNCMLRPLIPYAIRGAIWYQGESNANTKEDAESYYDKLRCMIEDWRYQWAQGNFPFIQMILANYREPKSFCTEDAWPTLREGQLRLCNEMPQVYAASAIDIGDEKDIHPLNKKDAGFRMARIALTNVYHVSGIIPGGPRLQQASVEGDRIRLKLKNSQGLAFRGGEAKGFWLTDAMHNVLPIESAVIENDMLLLQYKAGTFPTEIYYSWADNPDGNLENEAKLPADPFHIRLWS